MKLALSTGGKDLNGALDRRFGRAVGFLIYETTDQSFEIVDNEQNMSAAQGAGIQAAQNVIKTGAEAVITGHCGPKAFKMLKAAGVKVYNSSEETVKASIEKFRTGGLKAASEADVEGHWV